MSILIQIFNRNFLAKKLDKFDINQIPELEKKKKIISNWKTSIESSDLNKTKEEAIQGLFLINFFSRILGYKTFAGNKSWNLNQEQKTKIDGTKADGALGFFTSNNSDIRAVIELKDARTDLDKKQPSHNNITPVEQAFSYATKSGRKCNWVIVSNFKEIRLYHRLDPSEYEEFLIVDLLKEEEFKRLYYLLCSENLLSDDQSILDLLYKQNQEAQSNITSNFYQSYKTARLKLFEILKEKNPDKDELLLVEKSQKLMDRFIFVCFSEDTELLPEKIFRKVIDAAKHSFSLSENKMWEQLKGLFKSIDKGNPPMNINKFNGGLFKEDPDLDQLIITDEIFLLLEEISTFDFDSDLNVNILGHIFEQSITDIEEIRAEILSRDQEKNPSKRKRDGIFYTPQYITKYIVEKTIGDWLQDKRRELGEEQLTEIPDLGDKNTRAEKATRKKAIQKQLDFYENYRDILSNIKILDPACGSGAFLNQAFDFLYREGQQVNNIIGSLDLLKMGGTLDFIQTSLVDLNKSILKNNLYGVDLNKESVELTKLSLWLKTANRQDELSSLDENVKCGNSLIEDPKVSERPFKWQEEFADIMKDGGFDIIIGNPPYGAFFSDVEKKYLDISYKTTQYNYDSYKFFIELAFMLVKPNSYIGLITPNTYFVLEKSDLLRRYLFESYSLIHLVEIFDVFPDAIVEPIISIYKTNKARPNDIFTVLLFPRGANPGTVNMLNASVKNNFKHNDLFRNEGYLFNYQETEIERRLCTKINSKSEPLKTYAKVTTGIKPYQTGKGKPSQTKEVVKIKPFTGFEALSDSWYPLIRGTEVNRYLLKWSGEYIKYGKWLAEPRTPEIFFVPKLFIRRTDDRLLAVYDDTNMIGVNSIHCIQPLNEKVSPKYLLAIINSSLLNWVFRHNNFHMVGKPLAEVKVIYVERLPIIIADSQEEYITLVDEILNLNNSLYNSTEKFIRYMTTYKIKKITGKLREYYYLNFDEFIEELKKQKILLEDKTKFSLMELFEEQKRYALAYINQINNIDKKIDEMVFNLYGLVPEEIVIVKIKKNIVEQL